jgi:hypothetical protein
MKRPKAAAAKTVLSNGAIYDQYQKRSRIRTTARLKAQAASLGFQLLPLSIPLTSRRI